MAFFILRGNGKGGVGSAVCSTALGRQGCLKNKRTVLKGSVRKEPRRQANKQEAGGGKREASMRQRKKQCMQATAICMETDVASHPFILPRPGLAEFVLVLVRPAGWPQTGMLALPYLTLPYLTSIPAPKNLGIKPSSSPQINHFSSR